MDESADAPDASLQRRYLAAQRRAQALYDLSTLITSTREINPIVELLLNQARQVFGADRGAVFLREHGGPLRCANAVGLSEGYLAAVNENYRRAAGGAAEVRRQPVYVADVQTDPLMGPLHAAVMREGIRSLVVVPFIHEDSALGALALYHDTPHPYVADDLAALTTFANQVAVALANARLFTAAERQLRRANFLVETGRLLNSSLEMGQVLHALSRSVTEVLGEACAIYLLHKNEEDLNLAAYTDTHPTAGSDRLAYLHAHLPRLGGGGIGQAALHGETLLVDENHPLAEEVPDTYRTAFGAHTYLVTPLLAQQRLVGAVVVWLFDPRLTTTPDDIQLLDALADQAAIALENARLYERELHAQQAKDEFLSAVSHELRTPLTAILGYTQLMRKSALDEGSRFGQQVNIIWSQAQRLNRLVDSLLDISNIEQGQLHLTLERVDLWAVVQGALERVRASSRPGLLFEVDAQTADCWVQADASRLSQVFEQLLVNAMKYSPADGTICLELRTTDSRAIVRIRDSGPGLSAAQLSQLFRRYYQGDTPLNRTGGLGLGLYISRAVIEAHGGTISATSASGGGAAFQVTLPCE